ncbi:MAG: hypothetical protein WCW25_05580 [Patescibacteria group bacterium]|jgi:hypothetical protein
MKPEKYQKKILNQKGDVLLVTLLILTSILTISLGAGALVYQGILLHRTQKWSTIAYFAAEAGMERILWESRIENFNLLACNDGDYISFNPAPACSAESAVTTLSNGAEYAINYNLRDLEIVLTSTGSYAETKRRVEASYGICLTDCTDKECGGDGCGGTCGTCDTGYVCSDGICVSGTPSGGCFDQFPFSFPCGWPGTLD